MKCLAYGLALTCVLCGCEDKSSNGLTFPCAPQSMNVTLKAQGNYYAYRDGREYVDLKPDGHYRRIDVGELKSGGTQAFVREEGCFSVRTGEGPDATYGTQILFEAVMGGKTTEYFAPTEIYRIDQSGASYLLTRNDDIADWGYAFCPDLSTPWEYCTELRNGNYMYYPNLSVAIQASLTSEAILIRTKFSFTTMDRAAFDSLWEGGSGTESRSANWRYKVRHVVDTPRYTDVAWRGYIKGEVPHMPDTGSPGAPPVCYNARKSVTLADGSTAFVAGQVCYVEGQYTFTAE